MNMRQVLEGKAIRGVHTIEARATMRQAVQALVRFNIGALVVVDGGEPVGIVTERDVLRQVANTDGAFLDKRVAEVMTRDLVIATYEMGKEEAQSIMTHNRFRHLPVMSEGKLVGMVSMGDVVRTQCNQVEAEVTYLRDYIAGGYR